MRRRDLVLGFGATAAWPLLGRAQQKPVPVIGFLSGGSPKEAGLQVEAFRQGLGEAGYAEPGNVAIEFRWGEGHYDRLPALAAQLVQKSVAVIAAVTLPAALAAKAATQTIPIVFNSGDDPVKQGLVASLARPGGNATGVSFLTAGLNGKRLELLREMLPQPRLIAVLVNPKNPNIAAQTEEIETAARSVGQAIRMIRASTEAEIDAVFAEASQGGISGAVVAADPLFLARREPIVALAARYRIPTVYEFREFVAAGGLASYGSRITQAYHQVGLYTGKILGGAKPADLPVMQPTAIELAINLNTAKALGLTISALLLARADEVIE
jgi:putative tryptophan/tyrosine transport system substrate-binding protein